jgi:hypothetical protein
MLAPPFREGRSYNKALIASGYLSGLISTYSMIIKIKEASASPFAPLRCKDRRFSIVLHTIENTLLGLGGERADIV